MPLSINSKLYIGKKKVSIFGEEYTYTGELDRKGNCCGEGIAYDEEDPEDKFEGIFLDNEIHSQSKLQYCTQTNSIWALI